MRLLRRHNNDCISFTKDLSDSELSAYKYAILSHTWGPDEEEVKYHDIVNGTTTSGLGTQKIRFCVQQARKDGLEYFWVDTCCIDKTNIVELSRALISMYRWYSNAEKCYVLLSDVSDPASNTGFEHVETIVRDQFKASKWFKRGWTLQELLAPKELDFYSAGGYRLGSKTSLKELVANITQIPVFALQGQALDTFSIQERLSWQQHRQTKEPEDIIYSLLGIFDISMPILYGEGRAKAQVRLRKEIYAGLESTFFEEDRDLPAIVGAGQAQTHLYTCLNLVQVAQIPQAEYFASLKSRFTQVFGRLVVACYNSGEPLPQLKRLTAVCKEILLRLQKIQVYPAKRVLDVALLMQCIQVHGRQSACIDSTLENIHATLAEIVQNKYADLSRYFLEVERLLGGMELFKTLLDLTLDIYSNPNEHAQRKCASIVKAAGETSQRLQTLSILQQSAETQISATLSNDTEGADLCEDPGNTAILKHNPNCGGELRRWPLRRKNPEKSAFHIQLRCSWISSRIWNLAATHDQFGWDIHLRVITNVSCDSEIMIYTLRGDVCGIRELISARKASLSVQCNGLSLLEVAASMGHADLCKYFVDEGLHRNVAGISGLPWYVCLMMGQSTSMLDTFRYCMETYCRDIDLDEDDLERSGIWFSWCSSMAWFDIVLRYMTVPWCTRPIGERFTLAAKLMNLENLSPGEFLQIVGLERFDSRLISLRDYNGHSVLGVVKNKIQQLAFYKFSASHRNELQEWAQFGTQLLRMGLDPHETFKDGWTALLHCLDRSNDRSLQFSTCVTDNVDFDWPFQYEYMQQMLNIWMTLVQDAGLSLEVYFERETDILRTLNFTRLDRRKSKMGEIVYLDDQCSWTVKVLETTSFSVYQLDRFPGTFHPRPCLLPTICWAPSRDEWDKGCWAQVKTIKTKSAEVYTYHRNLFSPEPFLYLVVQTQDDTGVVALLVDQCTRAMPSKTRSCSAPPPIRHREAACLKFGKDFATTSLRRWLPGHHLCLQNWKYRIGCEYSVNDDVKIEESERMRRCIQSARRSFLSVQDSKRWRDNSFMNEIKRCQTGRLTYDQEKAHSLLRHDGTPQCPQGCSRVKFEKLPYLSQL